MTKRERLFALLKGQPVDRTPAGFWLHFPEEMHHGQAAVQAHLDFVRQTDTDIMKVMNENLFYDGKTQIRCLADIAKFRGFGRGDQIFLDQAEIIKRVSEKSLADYPVLATIHGLIASVFHETGFAGNYAGMGYCLALFCRERPAEMQRVFANVADSLIELVDLSLESGADGIFYAALGGEADWFTHDEYMEYVAPQEKRIYEHIKAKTSFDVLHICKSGIDFTRYTHLAPTVANWSIHLNGLSLTEGAAYFPNSILLGGFQDRSGVLVDGSDEEIAEKTRSLLREMEGRPYIVGSDCTLPTEISVERIRGVVRAIEAAQG